MKDKSMNEISTVFRKYTNGEYFADIDGKRIARKSIFLARVYPDSKLDSELIEYPSRIDHCGSCLGDAEDGYGMDECCCVHAHFHSKKEENDYVESIGLWKIPFEEQS